ncbi:hypothetical protein [Pelomonas sp. SE-A7]|uniref:hypothetical protein n=1 Tax=Pelomonas sp. SE-A7 TaxID=3054953 RepID=UPI00259CC793|nr:hypothetical protein [Pelomonas sp. SE-A7]MDM4765424.1 hypothetical protein [Pelomonas sp. SE-A7]
MSSPKIVISLCGGLLLLVGCASRPDTGERIGNAATAPLSDLNLVRDKIPQVLQEAQAGPYKLPADVSCAGLLAALAPLDEALGPDIDAPPRPEQGTMEKGGEMVGDAALDALKRTAEGLLPFRGWLRKLTGAERYSKEVAAAVVAGRSRRAFLKGMGAAKACPPPPPAAAATAASAASAN